MSQKTTALPQLHSAADVAQALGCSEWWVKEQARRGRIPFTKPGGSYRFTAEHFAEITRIFESRPTDSSGAAMPVSRAVSQAPPRRAATTAVAITSLKARTPRRARQGQSQSTAA